MITFDKQIKRHYSSDIVITQRAESVNRKFDIFNLSFYYLRFSRNISCFLSISHFRFSEIAQDGMARIVANVAERQAHALTQWQIVHTRIHNFFMKSSQIIHQSTHPIWYDKDVARKEEAPTSPLFTSPTLEQLTVPCPGNRRRKAGPNIHGLVSVFAVQQCTAFSFFTPDKFSFLGRSPATAPKTGRADRTFNLTFLMQMATLIEKNH
jgi:hypothetical protein